MSKKRLSKKTKPQRQKNTAIPVSTINSPNFDKILNNKGVELAKQGEFAQAATYFQQAIALNPTEAEFHNNLGIALTEQGKPIAGSQLQKFIKSGGDFISAKKIYSPIPGNKIESHNALLI